MINSSWIPGHSSANLSPGPPDLLNLPAITGLSSSNMEFIRDLFNFLKERKKWLLAPIVFILLLVGLLIVIGGGSAIAPFIYSIF